MAENDKEFNNKNANEETQQQKRCFIIMPFSDPEGYAPGHFRKVYDQIIKPAVEIAGYEAYRVDENGVSDLITTKIFKAILDCDMAICDLSSRNPNVLYELGIRHAFDKPVVLIKDNKTDRIFDIQGISTVEYRRERLYDEVIEDQKKISEAIKANENNSSGYSILSIVNMPKATYDANKKNSDSTEFNNALLMRMIDVLDKVEQNNFDKQFNIIQHTADIPETEIIQGEISKLRLIITEIDNDVDNLNSSNTTLKGLKEIESKIRTIKNTIYEIKSSDFITVRQSITLNYALNDLDVISDKIKKIKQDKLKNS